MDNKLKAARSIHFIGIGGIGISAIARMLLLDGKKVSGSDRDGSDITKELEKAGAQIYVGHNAQNIPADCDLVIYTTAIPKDNPEFAEAEKRSITLLSYPESLGIISKEKFTIAISGTHGKTTTTAMIAGILIEAQFEPTVLVGSLMKDPKYPARSTNFIPGKSKYFVVEADEYKKSFHNLEPSILLINNLDEDHLDFYKDLADIQASFRELAVKIPKDGFLVCNVSDPHLVPVISGLQCQIIDYKEYSDLDFNLQIPGEHNRSNAAAAFAVAVALGIDKTVSLAALQKFAGTWRRFEYKGLMKSGAIVYDDYAHNPPKIKAAIQGVREKYPGKKVLAIFQPHTYSRTKALFNEFITSLSQADEAVLVPIYAAREPLDTSVSSEILAEMVNKNGVKAQSFPNFKQAQEYIRSTADKDTIVINMSAGDATEIAANLLE